MVRKILPANDPDLREKSKTVAKIDKKVLGVIADLKDTLAIQKEPEGVGLAAPQIGKNLRIFVVRYGRVKRTVVNPKIIKITKTKAKKKTRARQTIMEGCLSLPHYYGALERASKVALEYTNEQGQLLKEEFKGFTAQIILHEIDHLNGILFIDRILEQKKNLYRLKGRKWEEVELL